MKKILILLGFSILVHSASAALFFDDFEANNFNKWEVHFGTIVSTEKGLSAQLGNADFIANKTLNLYENWSVHWNSRITAQNYFIWFTIYDNYDAYNQDVQVIFDNTDYFGSPSCSFYGYSACMRIHYLDAGYVGVDTLTNYNISTAKDANGWVYITVNFYQSKIEVQVNNVTVNSTTVINPEPHITDLNDIVFDNENASAAVYDNIYADNYSVPAVTGTNDFRISRLSPRKREKFLEDWFWEALFIVCMIIAIGYFTSFHKKK